MLSELGTNFTKRYVQILHNKNKRCFKKSILIDSMILSSVKKEKSRFDLF